MNIKMFHGNNLPNLSKTQRSKIIQSEGFLGSLLSKLASPLMKVAGQLKNFRSIRNNSCCFSN